MASLRLRHLIVLIGVFFVGFLASWAGFAALQQAVAGQSTKPDRRQELEPYTILLTDNAGRASTLAIRAAADCEPLGADAWLAETCKLALHKNPAVIAGSAFGRLNLTETPALEALIWRARIDRDASICRRGGLAGDWLSQCLKDSSNPLLSLKYRDYVITVPAP